MNRSGFSWSAKRPRTFFKEIGHAIFANTVVLPNGRHYVPRAIKQVSVDPKYDIFFNDGSKVSNVELSSIELPSSRYFDLLMGAGSVRVNVDFSGEVHEDFIVDYSSSSALKTKYDRVREENRELRFELKYPLDSPVAEKREKEKAEHFGDVRRKLSRGSRRSGVSSFGLPSRRGLYGQDGEGEDEYY